MINLTDIKNTLNPDYIIQDTFMEEEEAGMKVDILYSQEYILFHSDKKGAKYLECFHPKAKCVNKKADYVIITLKRDTVHCIIVELKNTHDPKEQLQLTEYFVEFIFKRIFRKYKMRPNIVIRKIGAFKNKLPNGYKINPRKLYDKDDFAYIKGDKFNLGQYL
jgi:hypothetical protein